MKYLKEFIYFIVFIYKFNKVKNIYDIYIYKYVTAFT